MPLFEKARKSKDMPVPVDPMIVQGAMQAATSGVNAGMGLLMQGHNDRRQLKQQKKLNALQVASNKEMAEFQYGMDMKKWEATGYGAQKKQMKEAGINPALMYGMGGGGGQSSNAGTGAGVNNSGAPAGGGEIQDMMGMGMQMQLLQAQKENIIADTKLKEVDANKTAGVDTKESEARTLDLLQGVENKRQQEEYQKVQNRIVRLDEELKGKTLEDQVEIMDWTAQKIHAELEVANNEAFISRGTKDEKVKMVKAELVGIGLRNILTSAQTKGVMKGIQLTDEQIKIASREIAWKWKELELKARETLIREKLGLDQLGKEDDGAMKIISEMLDGVMRVK